jgi:hypothetical protein
LLTAGRWSVLQAASARGTTSAKTRACTTASATTTGATRRCSSARGRWRNCPTRASNSSRPVRTHPPPPRTPHPSTTRRLPAAAMRTRRRRQRRNTAARDGFVESPHRGDVRAGMSTHPNRTRPVSSPASAVCRFQPAGTATAPVPTRRRLALGAGACWSRRGSHGARARRNHPLHSNPHRPTVSSTAPQPALFRRRQTSN